MEHQWLNDYQRKIEGLKQQAAQVHEGIMQSKAVVTSRDGAVTVTVGASGALEDLQLTPRASDMSYVQLGQSIMTAVRQAQRQVAERVAEAIAPMGATETMDLLSQHLPPDPGQQPSPRPSRSVDNSDDGDEFGGSIYR